MTKDQFLKTYGQPNTVVSFKNDADKMEFLNECERIDIKWADSKKATYDLHVNSYDFIEISRTGLIGSKTIRVFESLDYTVITWDPSPKSLIKDGWMGKNKIGASVYFMPSIDIYIFVGVIYHIEHFDDNLIYGNGKEDRLCIMELYDNLGNLQWKREEKSAKDIEIERIQSEMNKLADNLSKLKGE